MARTVADLKLLFVAMQGPDDGDPSAAPVPLHWPEPQTVKEQRIGYFEDDGRTPVTAETRLAVQVAADALRRAGFRVEEFRPDGLEKARQLWWKYFGIAGGMLLRPLVSGHESDLSPVLKQFMGWVSSEPEHTADSLHDLLREMHRERGLTSIIATHNPRLAAACDRVLRLEDGRLKPA